MMTGNNEGEGRSVLNKGVCHILIVEDEVLVRWSIETDLRKEGYNVRGVESGEEALAHVDEDNVDLIILDINLPGMTGLEVLETLRGQGHTWPVIVITAFEDAWVRESCRKLDVHDLVAKPFTLEEVRTAVENALVWASRQTQG